MKRREAARGPAKSRRRTGMRKGRKTSIARESTADLRVQLDLRTRERDEALEQQAATTELLRGISRSTFDLQAMLDTLVESAARLCNANRGLLFRREGSTYYAMAFYGYSQEFRQFHENHPITPGRGTAVGRTALEGKTVNIPDVLSDPEYTLLGAQKLGHYRANLAVPLLRDAYSIGALSLTRSEPIPFSAKQIELVQTFAAQAVIAIENTRLLDELRERTGDLEESLKYQTATSDVLKVISRSTFDLQPILDTLVETAARLCQSETGLIAGRDGDFYRGLATFAYAPEYAAFWRNLRLKPTRATLTGRVAIERRVIHIIDTAADPEYVFPESVTLGKNRTLLGVPLLREGEPIGVISFGREKVEPFTERQIELVRTFADQAVIAMENARLISETREALEQQTATAEVLRVINSSPGDLAPVFDAMLEKAHSLCEVSHGSLQLYDGERFHAVANLRDNRDYR